MKPFASRILTMQFTISLSFENLKPTLNVRHRAATKEFLNPPPYLRHFSSTSSKKHSHLHLFHPTTQHNHPIPTFPSNKPPSHPHPITTTSVSIPPPRPPTTTNAKCHNRNQRSRLHQPVRPLLLIPYTSSPPLIPPSPSSPSHNPPHRKTTNQLS